MREYPADAIERAKSGALEWLQDNTDGYPRSTAQENQHTKRRGYEIYDDFKAPPILGYEALEKDGAVVRLELVYLSGEERVHFKLVTK